MTIRFHCEHCGKEVEAPDSAGGRRGKCPYCHGSNYIPSAEGAEEIPVSEPDAQDERMRELELKRLRQEEKMLLAESVHGENSPRLSERDGEEIESSDLHHLVVNYCLDMAAGNLDRGEELARQLKKYPSVNKQAVDDFLSGQVIEPALDKIPVRVVQGFLKTLLAELR